MHSPIALVVQDGPPLAGDGFTELLDHCQRMGRLIDELDVLCRAVEDTPGGQELQATASMVEHLACHLRASDQHLEGLLGRVGRLVEER